MLPTSTPSLTAGAQELGQSITAPCTGFIQSISPVINTTGSVGTTWSAVMRVYDGPGTLGTELSAGSFSFENPAVTAFYLTIGLPAPVPVTKGQVYTWFMDLTSANDRDAVQQRRLVCTRHALPDGSMATLPMPFLTPMGSGTCSST